ncbi:MAG TPA: hypothetical protein VKY92_06200, partial [Verrucomicrobiae bacterium]|nr:hypothetical protein [Verrucomicrobiae bacterium]
MLCTTVSKAQIEAALNAARIKFGPHANTGIQNTGILIFMNKAAAEAFSTNAVPFPVGAVIVKQKTMSYFDKDGKSVREENMGVGGMVKRPAG